MIYSRHWKRLTLRRLSFYRKEIKEDYDYDIYEDWFADVKFYVEGFKKVADKLGLRRVER